MIRKLYQFWKISELHIQLKNNSKQLLETLRKEKKNQVKTLRNIIKRSVGHLE